MTSLNNPCDPSSVSAAHPAPRRHRFNISSFKLTALECDLFSCFHIYIYLQIFNTYTELAVISIHIKKLIIILISIYSLQSYPAFIRGKAASVKLFLGYESAIEYWRAVGSGLAPRPKPSPITRVSGEMTSATSIIEALPNLRIGNCAPTHALVSRKSRSYRSDNVVHHVCSGELPSGSFSDVSNRVIVASPALCLLHAAQHTKPSRLLPLIELCFEMLGGYSLCEGTKRGFVNHAPFLTKAEIDAFLRGLLPHTRGKRALMRALRYALPNSRSPRETEAALLLTLPEQFGGYAFPSPTLNFKVHLSEQDRRLTDKECFYLDLYWEGTLAAFEYDGADHSDPEQIAEDKARRNLLSTMGFRLIVVEKAHAGDIRTFNQQIAQLARLIGVEVAGVNRETTGRRTRLMKYLFNPQHLAQCTYTRPLRLETQAPVQTVSTELF